MRSAWPPSFCTIQLTKALFARSRRPAIPRARNVYRSALSKPNALDWPEAVFSAFLAFEEMFGSLDTLDQARLLFEKAQGSVAAKRQEVRSRLAEAGQIQQVLTPSFVRTGRSKGCRGAGAVRGLPGAADHAFSTGRG